MGSMVVGRHMHEPDADETVEGERPALSSEASRPRCERMNLLNLFEW